MRKKISYKTLYNNTIIDLELEKKKNLEYENIIKKLKNEIITLKEENKILNNKGSLCSKNGKIYEQNIHKIVNNCYINNNKFNIQNENDLGSSSSKNDIICLYDEKYIGIEVKKFNTPDWMQCSIKYNNITKKWETSKKNKIPNKSRDIFENLINNIDLFNNEIPPFFEKNITHDEWKIIKQNTNKWNDIYIDIPQDTIRKLYNEKNCQYIQISNGYGLYHLGNDLCSFNVPLFNIEQHMRIRIKIHNKNNKNGYCSLSVIASCLPKNINLLDKSNYSLDNISKLPEKLLYKINQ